MSNTSNVPQLKVEIVSAPSVKDMTVSQVGQNMFSINLNIITVVRFPADATMNTSASSTLTTSPMGENSVHSPEQRKYADGLTPQAGGETAAFNDFSKQHGYAPQTREILTEWVKLQQGGA